MARNNPGQNRIVDRKIQIADFTFDKSGARRERSSQDEDRKSHHTADHNLHKTRNVSDKYLAQARGDKNGKHCNTQSAIQASQLSLGFQNQQSIDNQVNKAFIAKGAASAKTSKYKEYRDSLAAKDPKKQLLEYRQKLLTGPKNFSALFALIQKQEGVAQETKELLQYAKDYLICLIDITLDKSFAAFFNT